MYKPVFGKPMRPRKFMLNTRRPHSGGFKDDHPDWLRDEMREQHNRTASPSRLGEWRFEWVEKPGYWETPEGVSSVVTRLPASLGRGWGRVETDTGEVMLNGTKGVGVRHLGKSLVLGNVPVPARHPVLNTVSSLMATNISSHDLQPNARVGKGLYYGKPVRPVSAAPRAAYMSRRPQEGQPQRPKTAAPRPVSPGPGFKGYVEMQTQTLRAMTPLSRPASAAPAARRPGGDPTQGAEVEGGQQQQQERAGHGVGKPPRPASAMSALRGEGGGTGGPRGGARPASAVARRQGEGQEQQERAQEGQRQQPQEQATRPAPWVEGAAKGAGRGSAGKRSRGSSRRSAATAEAMDKMAKLEDALWAEVMLRKTLSASLTSNMSKELEIQEARGRTLV